MENRNFAAWLHRRCPNSRLMDATAKTGHKAGDFAQAGTLFLAAGIRAGEWMVLACDQSPISALAYLGALYAGITPILVHTLDLSRHLAAILRVTGAGTLWVPSRHTRDQLPETPDGVRVLCGLDVSAGRSLPLASSSRPWRPAMGDEDGVAVLMPTSGSTSQPRLVAVTHGNLIANTVAIVRSQRLQPSDRAMLILPVSYCFGASVLHTHLAAGGDVVFDRRFLFPNQVLRSIDEYQCTTFAGVPTAYRTLMRRSRLKNAAPRSLRRFLQAGGPLAWEEITEVRAAAPHVEFFVMYGQTEATARITTLDPAHLDECPGSVGRPLDNLEVRITTEDGQPCGPGEIGEILVRGPSIARGYWNDPAATAEKFVQGWLRTGDFGRMDDAGFVYVTGRRESFVKTRGLRVSLHEVEQLVQRVAGVEEAAACATPHAEAGEAIAVFIKAAGEAEPAGVVLAARSALPRQWEIAEVTIVDRIPKTSNGKLDRAELAALAHNQQDGGVCWLCKPRKEWR